MKDLKIGTKIMIGFGTVIGILIIISCLSFWALASSNNGFKMFYRIADHTRLAGDLESSLLRTRLSSRFYFMSGNEKDLKAYENDYRNLETVCQRGTAELQSPEMAEKMKMITALLGQYNSTFGDIAKLIRSHGEIRVNVLDKNGVTIRESIAEILEYAFQNGNLKAAVPAGELLQHFLLGRLYLYRFMDTHDEAALAQSNDEYGKIPGYAAGIEKTLTGEKEKVLLSGAREALKIYLSTRDDLVRMTREEVDLTNNHLVKIGNDILDKTNDIRTIVKLNEDALEKSLSSRDAVTMVAIVVFSMISLIIAVTLALVISRQITGPVNNALAAVNRIAEGDLTGDFKSLTGNDEIGLLMAAMDGMQESLIKISQVVNGISEGELAGNFVARSAKDALGHSVVHMVANLTKQAQGLAEAVNVISSSATEIVATTTQLASNASETAASASETTITVEEVRQTADVSNQKAKYVSESAQKASEIAKAGKKAVEDTMEGMNWIKEKMESVAESIVTLSEQSQAIGEIIAAVDDIAEQTNLLAVNASIEAVKAGELGKGFSVVALEIKALADQSKLATKQVRSILNDIQKATGKAVMATEEGAKTVDAGGKLSVQSGENIQALANAIAEAAQAAIQIAASSQQQFVGMDQVAAAMENVKTASAQNAAGARQMEIAIQNLSELGNKLKSLVSWYRIAV